MARKYRLTDQPYSEAKKLLTQDSLGITMTPKDYYNMIRHKIPDRNNLESVVGIVQALNEEGLKVRFLARDEVDKNNGGKIVRRTLTNVFFWSSESVPFAGRWAAGHCLLLDATFNTNRDRLPLLIAVRITNEGVTFPIAFAFIQGETAEAFTFFFKCLREEVSVTASLNHRSFSLTKLQDCYQRFLRAVSLTVLCRSVSGTLLKRSLPNCASLSTTLKTKSSDHITRMTLLNPLHCSLWSGSTLSLRLFQTSKRTDKNC